MKEITHLVRWAIPGTILVGSLIFFLAFQKAIMGVTLIAEFNLGSFLQGQELIGLVAFLVLMSAPLGFAVYQIYYWLYWRQTDESFWHIVPYSHTKQTNHIRSTEWFDDWFKYKGIDKFFQEIIGRRQKHADEWKNRLNLRMIRWFPPFIKFCQWRAKRWTLWANKVRQSLEWIFIDKLVLSFLGDKKKDRDPLIQRLAFLNDLFHSLGATIVSVFISCFIFVLSHVVLYFCHYQEGFTQQGIPRIFCVLFAIVIMWLIRKACTDNRRQTARNTITLLLITVNELDPKE
ncbi:MAG: hypothetical protein WCS69_01630 [Ignavibacteriaceae bacterium]|jgi:hypothetical protein